MNFRRGFTIVEIVIVMVIMGVLIGLAVLNISSTQANARDNERKTDAENIARGLETRYKEGNSVVTNGGTSYTTAGAYPGINEWYHMAGFNKSSNGFIPAEIPGGYATKNLPGTSMESFNPPGFNAATGIGGSDVTCVLTCPPAESSYIDDIFNDPVKKLKYYYEPIDANGNVCGDGPCVRFNLYYWQETTNTYKTIRSKHQ
jgi:prepilin-type N-terminal cleavage/methylation domain-containing protein